MSSQSTADGRLTLTVTFELGTDLDKAQVLVQNRVAPAEPRLPEEVRRAGRHGQQDQPRHHDGRSTCSRPTTPTTRSTSPTTPRSTCRDRLTRLDGVGDVSALRRARLFDARLARPRQDRRARPDRRRHPRRPAAPERPGAPPARRPAAVSTSGIGLPAHRRSTQGRLRRTRAVREHRRQDRRRRPAGARARRRPRRAGRAGLHVRTPILDRQAGRRHRRRSSARAPTPSPPPTQVIATPWRSCQTTSRKGLDYSITYNPTEFVEVSIAEVQQDPVRGDGPGRAGRLRVPADLARRDHPGRSPFRSR